MNIITLLEKPIWRKVLCSLVCILTTFVGFLCGLLYQNAQETPAEPVEYIGEINSYVPSLHILALEDNMLAMKTGKHDIRIHMGGTSYNAPKETIFSMYIQNNEQDYQIIEEATTMSLNEPCLFVASSQGKYAYPIEHKKASTIKNIVCFDSIEKAEDAGYIPYVD